MGVVPEVRLWFRGGHGLLFLKTSGSHAPPPLRTGPFGFVGGLRKAGKGGFQALGLGRTFPQLVLAVWAVGASEVSGGLRLAVGRGLARLSR